MTNRKNFRTLTLQERAVKLMESEEDYGGPQSIYDICRSLGISNTHSRTILVRTLQKGLIERMGQGIYRIPGDARPYRENKKHLES